MTAQKFVGLQLVQSPGREFGDKKKKKKLILYLEEESTLLMGFSEAVVCHGQDLSNVNLPISSPFRVTAIQDSRPFVFLSLITPTYLYSWNSKDKTP